MLESGYSTSGVRAGYGRGEGSYTLAGVCISSASCGRTSLYSRRKRSSSRCCARQFSAVLTSCFSVRCMRSCRPFCSGCPAWIRSGTIPSLIHHTASRDNPPTVTEAKGGPLSVRMASGSPYSRNAASKMARTRSVSVFSTACERSRYRLHASLMVNGSTRAPSPARNHPLKSAHHTRFEALACASGSRYGSVRRRFLRATTSPARLTISPIVLVAGHLRPGWSRSRIRFSFRGPQRMCA